MAIQACTIRIQHSVVRHSHVLTSPDVPELFVSGLDEASARRALPSALECLERTRQRRSQPAMVVRAAA